MDNFSIDEVLLPGKGIQLEFIGENTGEKIIAKTKVSRWEELYLIMDLPKREDAFNQLSVNSVVTIVCKHNDELQDYVFTAKFIRVQGRESPEIVLSKPTVFSMGRQALRYAVEIPFSYFHSHKEYKGGMVENLSINGLLAIIQSDENLKVGLEIPIKITLPTTTSPILIVGRIVRIVKEDGRAKIAMHFPFIARELQDQITKFLFSSQKSIVKKDHQKARTS